MASDGSGIDTQREEVDLEEEEDDQNVDELECFDDFTVASSWERLISDVEVVCRRWLADGPTSLQEFNTKQLVKMREGDAVASLFPLPTANQSWRKVLSMGNLLNGHEPALREIIFSVYETDDHNHIGAVGQS